MNRLSEGVPTATSPVGGSVGGNEDDAYLGKVLGGYRVDSLVTSIPRLRVYSAREVSSGAEAMIKVIDPGEADAATIDKFLKEAHAAGSLGHPNVVATRAIGKIGEGSVYQVTERLTGPTLD